MGHGLKGILLRRGRRLAIGSALEVAAILARMRLGSALRGQGVIFTLHHVRPEIHLGFVGNRHLEITPDFLDTAILQLRDENYEFIRLEDISERINEPHARPFACFTLDDGYRNNRDHALPVFERHDVPFTIFVTRGLAERTHSLWWETLGQLLHREETITFDFGNGPEDLRLPSETLKLMAFKRFARLIASEDEASVIRRIDNLAQGSGVDPLKITADLVMNGDELRKIAGHPLASLGAHTISHRALARLPHEEVRQEIRGSVDWVEGLSGTRPQTFAYPYGFSAAVCARDTEIARDAGLSVAVTTKPGIINGQSPDRLTALPRVSLNGYFQKRRYVSALASGIPFALSRHKPVKGTS